MAQYIVYSFKDDSDADFAQKVQNVIVGMEGNPDFPNPPCAIEVLLAHLTTFRSMCRDRDDVSTNERKQRRDLRKEMQRMLRANALFVINLFLEDKLKQLSSGYPSVTERSTDGVAKMPTGLSVKQNLRTGVVSISFKGKYNARSFFIRWRPAGSQVPFQFLSTGKSVKNVILGLVPGVNYEFFVKAIGAKVDSAVAGPVYFRPQ